MGKSIISTSEYCFICRQPATELHHCIFGRFRKLSDKYGLTVPLCRRCHEMAHKDAKTATELKRIAQKVFDDTYGQGEFQRIFGINFRE